MRGLVFDWQAVERGSYLRRIEAFKGLGRLDFSHPVTLFVGENGSGKSTLLEGMAVACGFNPEGGTKNYRFSTRDTHPQWRGGMQTVRGYRRERWGCFFRAESFYNLATREEQYADALHPSRLYHERSHGEGTLAWVGDNLRPDGLYLLDEPEAALSPQRQLALLLAVERNAKRGAQFFIATHSPILLGAPGAGLLCFDRGRVHPCRYEETESYQVTRMFLQDREGLLRRLLAEEGRAEGDGAGTG